MKAHRKTPSNEDGSAHSDGPVPQSPVHGSPVAALQTSLSAGSSKTKSRTSRVLLERRHSISELNIKSSEILEMEGGETAAQEISRRSRRKTTPVSRMSRPMTRARMRTRTHQRRRRK